MALRKHEIQEIYLSVQTSLGQLIAEANAADGHQLVAISVRLLNVKRNMLGTFDEINTEKLSP